MPAMAEVVENQDVTKSDEKDTSEETNVEYAGVLISLENCIFPKELFNESASHKDGLSKETENDLRFYGCQFIQTAGILLKVQQVAMATAQVLFQRFYYAKSFVKHKMLDMAMACIWLASKVEECPRRVRDVINVFHCLEQKRKKLPVVPMNLDQEYVTTKNNVIKAERRLLKELGFCVHVKHPHKIIVVYLQLLEMEKNVNLVQTAWNYMNDSFRTSVFVQYSPETIACACIFLAARVLKIPLPNNPEWFTIFNAKEEDLQDICISLLSVYQLKISSYETADSKVLECREAIQLEKQRARGILGGTDKVANSANNSPVSNSSTPRGSSIVLEKDHSNLAKKAVMGSSKNHAQKERRNAHYDNYNSAKRSRTRSTSNKHNMSSGSSEYSSDSDDGKSRKKARKNDKDILPKSYSQHNNSDNYREKRRHRHHKRHKSHRSDSHHRSRKSRRSSREKPQGYRSESSNKKHKRKLEKNGIPDLSLRASISQNGENKSSPPSKSHKKHSRAYRDERKKRSKRERSPDQHIRSTSATKP